MKMMSEVKIIATTFFCFFMIVVYLTIMADKEYDKRTKIREDNEISEQYYCESKPRVIIDKEIASLGPLLGQDEIRGSVSGSQNGSFILGFGGSIDGSINEGESRMVYYFYEMNNDKSYTLAHVDAEETKVFETMDKPVLRSIIDYHYINGQCRSEETNNLIVPFGTIKKKFSL